MRRGRRRWSRFGRAVNLAGAALVSAAMLWVMAPGFGAVPPLGAVLDAPYAAEPQVYDPPGHVVASS